MNNQKNATTAFKHIDFVIADAIILQLAFYLATLIYSKSGRPVVGLGTAAFRREQMVLLGILLLSLQVENPYKNILKRNKWQELAKMFQHTFLLAMSNIAVLFIIHDIGITSRIITGYMWIIYFVGDLFFRLIWKRVIRKYVTGRKAANRQIVICAARDNAENVIYALLSKEFLDFDITAVFLSDYDEALDKGTEIAGYKVQGSLEDMMNFATHSWTDEVILSLADQPELKNDLKQRLGVMGIEVHDVVMNLYNGDENITAVAEKMGSLIVVTELQREIPLYQWALKKIIDIAGALVGCLLTGIIFIFIAPAIYSKSPGPIFFAQDRVGKNGKVFKMYKFRSMYMDAEERKAELMKLNKVEDGMMFKMDDDPRIIGSEKKDANGKPKGIGNFIRNTSLDEFPQFFNVLKGDMSLVGTRPPTLDEWSKYSEHHRKRLSMRPGITGLWQVSGRSEITDFEKVVALDSQYIDTWTVGLDIRIILKTVGKVLKREGAE